MSGLPSIALLTYSTRPRGGVVHTVELAEALSDLGADVTVYALNKDAGGFYRPLRCAARLLPAAAPASGIDAVVAQRIAEMTEGLRALGGEGEHDVWHAQDCISANALAALREEGRIRRFLRTVHHLDDFDSAYLRECQERSVRAADRCAVVSATWQAALRAGFGVEAALIPNGVSLGRFTARRDGSEEPLRRRLGLGRGPILVAVGGVEPRKNSIALLRAFLELRRDPAWSAAQLVIAGGETLFDHTAYQREFAAVARGAGLLGERPAGEAPPLVQAGVLPDEEMPALYRLADVFVFPSVREGWGLALLEAMASGAPVVTSAQPPFTEFLMHGEDALLVDPRDPAAIASSVAMVLGDAELAGRLRAAALATAARYTWARSARAALAVYRDFLARTPR